MLRDAFGAENASRIDSPRDARLFGSDEHEVLQRLKLEAFPYPLSTNADFLQQRGIGDRDT